MPALGEPTPPAHNLRDTMRHRQVAALVADAEFIRDQPDGDEKTAEAKRHIREAMVRHALGLISMTERDRILDILSFAVIAQTSVDREPQLQSNLDSPAAHGNVT